jgi:predicted DsbA family dithiol-disulfide isomerase
MHIDISSYNVIPWCYIGKRRFETALQEVDLNHEITVRYRSFELDPSAPKVESRSMTQILCDKYGLEVSQVEEMQANVSRQAANEGLHYRLYLAKSGNSFDAHQLLHLAHAMNKQAALKERLMKAYFTEGMAIGDQETLVSLAEEVGIDADLARRILIDQTYLSAVRQDEQIASQIGITGVPFFVINMKYGISGAQATSVFVEALKKAREEEMKND